MMSEFCCHPGNFSIILDALKHREATVSAVKTFITDFKPLKDRLLLAFANGGYYQHNGELVRIISLEETQGKVIVDFLSTQIEAVQPLATQ